MSNINNSPRMVENFLVAKQGQTAIPTSGNLYTPSLNNGQLAFVSASNFGSVGLNVFTDATPTITEAPVIQIAQGNANSATSTTATATYPLWVRPYEISKPIDGRNQVRVTKQVYRAPAHNVWILGDTESEAGAFNGTSNTEYSMEIAFRGVRQETQYNYNQAGSLSVGFPTPDFSSTGLNLSSSEATTWIAQTTAYQINRSSKALGGGSRFPGKSPVIAFLVDKDGNSGVEIGGGTPLAAGDSVPVMTTPTTTYNFVFTAEQATSIKNAAIAATGDVIADITWTIVPVAYTPDVNVSGSTILLMGLDETQAYIDYVPQVKVSLFPALRTGFYSSVTKTNLVYADEGQGIGRVLDLQYKATEGQRKYAGRHVEDPVINFPSPVDTTLVYNTYVIHHANYTNVDPYTRVQRPAKELVLIPAYSTGTTTNPYLATFESVFNNWLASAVSNASIVTIE